jgi:hypothetical protein
VKLLRALAVVAGLGAIGGALVALVTLAALHGQAVLDASHGPSLYDSVMITLAGAGFGAVIGPLVGFGLLRDVPLGRALLGTGVGTLLGIGAVFAFQPRSGAGVALLPLLGMLVAAVLLRIVARRRGSAGAPRDPVA